MTFLELLDRALPADGVLFNVLPYGLVMGTAFAAAATSYRFYEEPLLNLKRRYTVVRSEASLKPSK